MLPAFGRKTRALHRLDKTSHHEDIDHARKRAIFLILFGIARMIAWMVFAVFVALGLLHIGPFGWASTIAAAVVFVTFISLYANWATDFDQVTAALATLAAIEARRAAEHAGDKLDAQEDQP